VKRPTVYPIPCPPKDDDQYCYQDHQQIVEVELKRRVKPLNANELIDQGHPLFLGKLLSSEAGYEHNEVSDRFQYIEKRLPPPLIPSNYQYACGGCRLPYSSGARGAAARRWLKDCHFNGKPLADWFDILFVASRLLTESSR